MIDFYRKSVLSQLGKDAGNQTMSDYVRNITTKYDMYLSEMRKEKIKPAVGRNSDFELYL